MAKYQNDIFLVFPEENVIASGAKQSSPTHFGAVCGLYRGALTHGYVDWALLGLTVWRVDTNACYR